MEKLLVPMRGKVYDRLKFGFLFLFLAFSLMWHYHIVFNQLERVRLIFVHENQDTYGNITAKHLKGWDTYDVGFGESIYHPEGGFYYTKDQMGNRLSTRLKDIPLPLKHVPEKGALIILTDDYGKAFRDWLAYYYPNTPEKITYNSYGETQFHYWEIPADQIQKALRENKPFPAMGLTVTAYGSKGNMVGKWHVPTFNSTIMNDEWFFLDPATGQPTVLWKKIASLTITGYMNTEGKPVSLDTNGKVSGFFGGKSVRLDGTKVPPAQIELVSSKGWTPVNLRYFPREAQVNLNLKQHNVTGWDLIPASELSTTPRH